MDKFLLGTITEDILILLETVNKPWNVFSHGCSLFYCEKTVLSRSPAFTRPSEEEKKFNGPLIPRKPPPEFESSEQNKHLCET